MRTSSMMTIALNVRKKGSSIAAIAALEPFTRHVSAQEDSPNFGIANTVYNIIFVLSVSSLNSRPKRNMPN